MIPLYNAYKYKHSQVKTPKYIVNFYWQLLAKYRSHFGNILDMGAGDGRFSYGGNYSSYDGVEIDKERYNSKPKIPENAAITYNCIFEYPKHNYDVCIGNPPYLRHHEIDSNWREKVLNEMETALDIKLSRQCNLFNYFIILGLIKTKPDGIVSLIVPYDWLYRPSSKALRQYIELRNWNVDVYRFKENIFSSVETSASISIIDKAGKSGKWQYYAIKSDLNIKKMKNILGTNYSTIEYEKRGDIWALRGLSPGTQKIFTLTETQRLKNKLLLKDLYPCVTSLRKIPRHVRYLNSRTFRKYIVNNNQKCWLIRSEQTLSKRLKKYLDNIPDEYKNTTTCKERELWYVYNCYPPPKILYNSGFTKIGPNFIINKIRAIAVGGIQGIHSKKRIQISKLYEYLNSVKYEKRIISYSGKLKKIEVRQMNSILNDYKNNLLVK